MKNQPWIYIKLKETPNLDGVVFFTALQFSYGGKFNIKLFNRLINDNYEVHFAREDLSFSKKNLNQASLNFLLSNSLVFQRDDEELLKLI